MAKPHKETPSLLRLEKDQAFDLWREHARMLQSWDDLTLARWMNQILGQLHEKSWRASHPLVLGYRLGLMVAHQRDLWNRRVFPMNEKYQPAPCCGSPSVPLVTFEVVSHGIYCTGCGEILQRAEELSALLGKDLLKWHQEYDLLHQVSHWDEERQKKHSDYGSVLDDAATRAAPLLARLGYELVPRLLSTWATILWEDSDHCMEIIPEDVMPQEDDLSTMK